MKKAIFVLISIMLYCLVSMYSVSAVTNISVTPDVWNINDADRGGVVQHEFTILNVGNITQTFTLSMQGSISLWSYITPNYIYLEPGQSGSFSLALFVPTNAEYAVHQGTLRIETLATNNSYMEEMSISVDINKYNHVENKTISTTQEISISPQGYTFFIESLGEEVELIVMDDGVQTAAFTFSPGDEQELDEEIKIKLVDRYGFYAKFEIYSVNEVTLQVRNLEEQQTQSDSDCELEPWVVLYPVSIVQGVIKSDNIAFENTCDEEVKIRQAWFMQGTTETNDGEKPATINSQVPPKIEPGDSFFLQILFDTKGIEPKIYSPILRIDYEVGDDKRQAFVNFKVTVKRTTNIDDIPGENQTLVCPRRGEVNLNQEFVITYKNIQVNQQVWMEKTDNAIQYIDARYDGNHWVWEGTANHTGQYELEFSLRENGAYLRPQTCNIRVIDPEEEEASSVEKNITIDHILPEFNEGKLKFQARLPSGKVSANAAFTIDVYTTTANPSLIRTYSGHEIEGLSNRKYCVTVYAPGYKTQKKCVVLGLRKMKIDMIPVQPSLGDLVTFTFRDVESNDVLKDISVTVNGTRYTANPFQFKASHKAQYTLNAIVGNYEKWTYSFTPLYDKPKAQTPLNLLTITHMTPVENRSINKNMSVSFNKITGWVVNLDGKYYDGGQGDLAEFTPKEAGNYTIYAEGSSMTTIELGTKSTIENSTFLQKLSTFVLFTLLAVGAIFVVGKGLSKYSNGGKKPGAKVTFPRPAGPLEPVSLN
jgi:hypothetical protein